MQPGQNQTITDLEFAPYENADIVEGERDQQRFGRPERRERKSAVRGTIFISRLADSVRRRRRGMTGNFGVLDV